VSKLESLDFVAAARVIGVPEARILTHHILPNTTHLLLVQATIAFVAAIKSEVILSFIGLGMKDGVSWGSMIAESTGDIAAGHYGNFVAASVLMFGLVLAFNVLADALQDALDPRMVQPG
jgi:peptide/nickel transport system permease protein